MKKSIKKNKHKETLRCVTYDRVSTFDQAFNSDGSLRVESSTDAQQQRCLDYIKSMEKRDGKKREVVEVISDKAVSGKNTKRDGFQHMINLIITGAVDEVVTVELSRLSRSTSDFLKFAELCKEHNVKVVLISNNLDTSTDQNNLVLTMLASFAQFERETTGKRVRENALAWLVKNGKINGAAEILGLDRDPSKKGHFVVNKKELEHVEVILKSYVKSSSKTRVLEEAREKGITGKHGKELTIRTIEYILENAKWRYRGLWYANKENEGNEDPSLPEMKRYQIVPLPHGRLIQDEGLLNQVEQRLDVVAENRKKKGKDNYTYLLTTVLINEDGSRYYGQPGKNRQYRYYYNQNTKKRIRCDELNKLVIAEYKMNILNDQRFSEMLERAITERESDLPKINNQILSVQNDLRALDQEENGLKQKLLSSDTVGSKEVIRWLDEQLEKINQKRTRCGEDLKKLQTFQTEILQKATLSNLRKQSVELLYKFNGLSGTEQRDGIEKLVKNVIVRSDNTIKIQFYGETKRGIEPSRGRKLSTEWSKIGVTNGA